MNDISSSFCVLCSGSVTLLLFCPWHKCLSVCPSLCLSFGLFVFLITKYYIHSIVLCLYVCVLLDVGVKNTMTKKLLDALICCNKDDDIAAVEALEG